MEEKGDQRWGESGASKGASGAWAVKEWTGLIFSGNPEGGSRFKIQDFSMV